MYGGKAAIHVSSQFIEKLPIYIPKISSDLFPRQPGLGGQVIFPIRRGDDFPGDGIDVDVGDLGSTEIIRKGALELDLRDLSLEFAVDGDLQRIDFVTSLDYNLMMSVDIFPILIQVQGETGRSIFPVPIQREVSSILGDIIWMV